MRKTIALFVILMASLPSMALTKITVEQLTQLLAEQHKLAKSDEATAVKLQDVSLSEQLTADKMNIYTQYDPGPLTVTQIRVLAIEVRCCHRRRVTSSHRRAGSLYPDDVDC